MNKDLRNGIRVGEMNQILALNDDAVLRSDYTLDYARLSLVLSSDDHNLQKLIETKKEKKGKTQIHHKKHRKFAS